MFNPKMVSPKSIHTSNIIQMFCCRFIYVFRNALIHVYVCLHICMYDNDKRGHELEREHGGIWKKVQWEEKEQGK